MSGVVGRLGGKDAISNRDWILVPFLVELGPDEECNCPYLSPSSSRRCFLGPSVGFAGYLELPLPSELQRRVVVTLAAEVREPASSMECPVPTCTLIFGWFGAISKTFC